MVVLLLIFGSLVAALLPVIIGLMSITITLGITYFIGQQYALSNFLPNIVSMIGLAVGIDYALFMVSRFREELMRTERVRDAVSMTSQTVGRSIVFSGVAVLIGLLGLLFIDLNIFTTLAVGGILVVAISVLAANTLLLSLFGILGNRINKWSIIPAKWRKNGKSNWWKKIAWFVMKNPVVLALTSIVFLIYLMIPFTDIKVAEPKEEVIPPIYESRIGSDLLKETFDQSESYPIYISVRTPDNVGEAATIREMEQYVQRIKQLPNVREVKSYLSVIFANNVNTFEEAASLMKMPEVREQLSNSNWLKIKLQ